MVIAEAMPPRTLCCPRHGHVRRSIHIMLPMTILTTSFMRAPAPTSPRKKCAFPMSSRAGTASLYKDSSPAAKKISVPSIAGFLLPDTGA